MRICCKLKKQISMTRIWPNLSRTTWVWSLLQPWVRTKVCCNTCPKSERAIRSLKAKNFSWSSSLRALCLSSGLIYPWSSPRISPSLSLTKKRWSRRVEGSQLKGKWSLSKCRLTQASLRCTEGSRNPLRTQMEKYQSSSNSLKRSMRKRWDMTWPSRTALW